MLMEDCILLYGVSVPTLNDEKWFLNAVINNNCSKFYFALVYVTVGSRTEWQLLLPVPKLNLTAFKTTCKNVHDYMYHSCKNIRGNMKFFPDNGGEWTIPIPSGKICLLHALPFQSLLQWWWPLVYSTSVMTSLLAVHWEAQRLCCSLSLGHGEQVWNWPGPPGLSQLSFKFPWVSMQLTRSRWNMFPCF